ncbi:hypothetical protein C7N43_01540 [Sphingobacteriales bacterium UPWRP_1]|nr:hypothetical protein C7N43_01540 [Sphingobacteriales bacterium UPWRP_1]
MQQQKTMESNASITALERIREAQFAGTSVLDLSNLDLTFLPEEIVQLKQLKELCLQNNLLSSLPAEIGNLPQLRVIHASGNQIAQVHKAIKKLNQLSELLLNDNKLNSLPYEFAQLGQLQTLNLNNNNFTDVPRALKQLPRLSCLHLCNNRLQRLPDTISQMTELEELYISGNEIDKLPDTIGQLSLLRVLQVNHNVLTILPPGIGQLSLLTDLDASHNLLHSLPSELAQLRQLKHLNLSDNRLSNIPLQIKNLTQLQNRPGKPGFNLANNRFNVPEELFDRRPGEIIQYLADLQLSKNKKPLHEAKLIFIGSGEVGKTSLISMLTTGSYNPAEQKTDGIQIQDWEVKRGNDHIKLHIWDFGGQEIMHATHKFFMTGRSVYVLVISPRTEDRYGDSELEYWLKLIRSFAGMDVPIVVVINKCETHKLDIAKGHLRDKYPNIVEFVETSCKDNLNIDKLENAITVAISELTHIDDLLPKSYFEIKQQLETSNKDFISYHDYQKICLQIVPDFTEASMQTLVNLLHDLGVMLNFNDDRKLKDTHVLNPEWVTQGVYQIITSPRLISKKGILSITEVKQILDPKNYPTDNERFYIMDMMQRFELCYQITETDNNFFIPGAFPKDKPHFEWNYMPADLLRFQYKYDIMPASIMALFIVKVHNYIRNNDFWRNGVVLRKDGCEALIQADPQDCKVYIEVGGMGNMREMLAFVRSQFEILHSRFSNLTIKKLMVYTEKNETALIDFDALLVYEQLREEYMVVPELKKKLSVKKLLSGIEPDSASTRNQYLEKEGINQRQRREDAFADTINTGQTRATLASGLKTMTILKIIGATLAGIISLLAGIAEITGENLLNLWHIINGK